MLIVELWPFVLSFLLNIAVNMIIFIRMYTYVCIWNVPEKLNSIFEFLADGGHNASITFLYICEVPVYCTFTWRKQVISDAMGSG
jgi:hypothetical protein